MSDDSLQVYLAGSYGVKFLESFVWETPDFSSEVAETIIKEGKRHPVIILNDMVEQHYRKERIPSVSALDKKNVLDRRLGIAFPNHKIRSALPLKNKSFEDKSRKGNPYLFAAIPTSNAYQLTVQAVEFSGAPLEGLYLLPVEASSVVATLSAKLSKKDRKKTIWTIFAGQHHNGGLRQIVTRDGELALTRMTPIVDTDIEPELWAKEVSNEISATMSYLARFGYKETDGLRIVVIANDKVSRFFEPAAKGQVHIMGSDDVASLLGVRLGQQMDGRYADPIHIAYLAKLNKFLLPMKSAAVSRLSMPRKIASGLLFLLLAGCAYFGYVSFNAFKETSTLSDRLVVAKQQKETLEQEYNRELEIKKAMGFDFALVNSAITVFNDIEREKMKPLSLMRQVGIALGTDIHLDSFTIKSEKVRIQNQDSADEIENTTQHFVNMVLSLSFPNSINPDLGVGLINNLQQRLQDNLPETYTVTITRQVADLSYTGNFVGGVEEEGKEPEDYFAEILIRGPVQ